MNDLLQSIGRGNEKKAILFVKGVFKWDSKNKYIDLLALWMSNSRITEDDTRLKSQYWPEICISMLIGSVGHYKVTFLLGFPRTLLIWKSSLPLFFPLCLLAQRSVTLEQWCLFWLGALSLKSVVSSIECAMCRWPRAYCSPVTSP